MSSSACWQLALHNASCEGETMIRRQTSDSTQSVETIHARGSTARRAVRTRTQCLEQILQAFRDIADHDDIHQASERLAWAQAWIQQEAERAAADPIFVELRLV